MLRAKTAFSLDSNFPLRFVMSTGCRGMLGMVAVAVAVLSVVIFHRSSPVYLGFFFDSRSRAESLRAPGPGVSGWIARKMMAIVNAESNVDVVESLLSVHSGHTVVELGPGHGFSLREILRKEPAHVYAIEVSESFRSTLAADSDFSKAVEVLTLTLILTLTVTLTVTVTLTLTLTRKRCLRYAATPGPAFHSFPRSRSIVFLV